MSRMAVDELGEYSVSPDVYKPNNTLMEIDSYVGVSNVDVASTLCFTVGIVMFVMAILRLEFVTAYFSDAVVGGFSTGAAFHVFVSQLKDFFGLSNLPKRYGAGNLFLKLYDIITEVPEQLNQTVMLISLLGLIFLILGKHYVTPFFKKTLKLSVPPPFELLLLVVVTGLSSFFHFHSRHNVPIVGELATGFPVPSLPVFKLVFHLIPHAITISIVVAAIHISLAKIFGKKYGYRTDPGQELYALGFSSILSSVFPMYPVSCSLSRTAVSVEAGTKTQLSTLFSSVIIAAVIVYFGQLLRTLPMCILSVVIMVALTNMLKKVGELKRLWPLSKTDFFIWLVSFGATVGYDVTEGLAISIAFALMTTVFRTQWPRWHYLANLKGTNDFRDAERYASVIDVNGICVFRFDAPLLFTNVESFKESIHMAALQWKEENPHVLGMDDLKIDIPDPEDTIHRLNKMVMSKKITLQMPVKIEQSASGLAYRHFVVDCSGFTFVDTMGVNALKEIFNELRSHMILVYFAAAKAPVRELFQKCGFYAYVPKSNFYPTIRDAVAIAKLRRDASTIHLLEELSLPYDPLDEQLNIHAVS
ncbi:unnamed protein product [Bursaphelenchus okinawaensis]|uniref:STAS domain-containing protein n=1 Tax=Bursaphelenchus okinawaensis TaxID=465554 RepID=A0A811LTL1_9BILA|nr:unnamed protein product [Bursaphelenchus okinawaensis]CAG9128695.1 unnamed protein product [Bursaphelenchus okinawaensis]